MQFIRGLNNVRAWIIAIAVLSMSPYALVVTRDAIETTTALISTARQNNEKAAAQIAADVRQWLRINELFMARLVERPEIKRLNCEEWLQDFIDVEQSASSVGIIAQDGTIKCEFAGPPVKLSPDIVRTRGWFKAAIASRGFHAGNLIFSQRAGQWIVPLSFPIRNDRREIIAYLFVAHKVTDIAHDMERFLSAGAVAGIIDGNGLFIDRSSQRENYIGKAAKAEIVISELSSPDSGQRQYIGLGPSDKNIIIATTSVPNAEWKVYSSIAEDLVLAGQRDLIIDRAASLLLATIIVMLVALAFGSAIVRPITAIINASRRGSAGAESGPVAVSGPVEIRELAVNFNTLRIAQHKAQTELRAAKQRYRELLQTASAVVWEANAKTSTFTFVSDLVERLLGYPKAAWLTQNGFWLAHVHPEDREDAQKKMQLGLTSAGHWEQVHRMIALDGRIVWTKSYCTTYLGENQELLIRGVTIDVTAEKQTELERSNAEKKLRQVLEVSGDAMFDWDVSSGIAMFSESWCALTGVGARTASYSEQIRAIIHPADSSSHLGSNSVLLDGSQRTAAAEYRIKSANDEWKWILDRRMIIEHSPDGRPSRIIGTFTDLTPLRKIEEARSAALQQYSDLVAAARDPIIAISPDGKIRLCNNAAVTAFGYAEDELMGSSLSVVLPQSVHARHDSWIKAFFSSTDVSRSMAQLRTVEGRRKDGTKLRLQVTLSKSVGLEGGLATAVIRDVTEIESLHEQLHQADKLAAVGQLTGGIAHDLNNILAVMSGTAEVIHSSLKPGSQLEVFAQRIVNAGQRGAELIKRLLAFSRKAEILPEEIDASDLIKELTDTLRRTLGSRIAIRFDAPSEPMPLMADRSMLESCLINLSVNARDAMPYGGTLTFDVRKVKSTLADQQGNWIQIKVTDTGLGMNEEVRRRIFEPFFTTKPQGQGTGLGLSMVYGFVQQSGGDIQVQSTQGEGTTFILYLPAATVQNTKHSLDYNVTLTSKPAAGHTILLVDDNDLVRDTLREQLEMLGGNVISAKSASEAQQIVVNMDSITFVVTDFDLGGAMNGVQFAEWIKESGRNLPGVIVSGFLNVQVERIQAIGWTYLPKPLRISDLAKAIRAAR